VTVEKGMNGSITIVNIRGHSILSKEIGPSQKPFCPVKLPLPPLYSLEDEQQLKYETQRKNEIHSLEEKTRRKQEREQARHTLSKQKQQFYKEHSHDTPFLPLSSAADDDDADDDDSATSIPFATNTASSSYTYPSS
jgi:hypothetical protein